jgi:hypothetical protein
MRALLGFLVGVVLGAAVLSQAQKLPDFGRYFAASRRDWDNVQTDCPLAVDKKAERFKCLPGALLSISRPADSLNTATASPPTLTCGNPCYLTFPDSGRKYVTYDFLMPSSPLSLRSILLSWRSTGGGVVVFEVDWCAYAAGEAPCFPSGANDTTISSTGQAGKRADAVFSIDPDWSPDDHVVVQVSRAEEHASDTVSGNVLLENVRQEMAF